MKNKRREKQRRPDADYEMPERSFTDDSIPEYVDKNQDDPTVMSYFGDSKKSLGGSSKGGEPKVRKDREKFAKPEVQET